MRMTLAMTLTWKLKFTKLHGHASATATRYTIAGRLGTESLPNPAGGGSAVGHVVQRPDRR